MDESGAIPEDLSLHDRLTALVRRHRIMIFMKGVPSAPRCGFSREIVALLDQEGVDYDAFNILEDEEVRQGLKTFSDWPTYPQLYIDGELIGGLDICKELAESGELSTLVKAK
jgi:Grx4 family monothiol glutaredoxin